MHGGRGGCEALENTVFKDVHYSIYYCNSRNFISQYFCVTIFSLTSNACHVFAVKIVVKFALHKIFLTINEIFTDYGSSPLRHKRSRIIPYYMHRAIAVCLSGHQIYN